MNNFRDLFYDFYLNVAPCGSYWDGYFSAVLKLNGDNNDSYDQCLCAWSDGEYKLDDLPMLVG